MVNEAHKIIKQSEFNLSPKPFIVGAGPDENYEPEITVNKEGELIKSIEVKCICGRSINIECL